LKQELIVPLVFLIAILCAGLGINAVYNSIRAREEAREAKIGAYYAYIGREIIIEKDTLTIVNADYYNYNYTLSNRLVVNSAYAQKRILK